MQYKLKWKRAATKEFKKLPKENQNKIINAVESLAQNPFSGNFRKMVNSKNSYRIRVGSYRVIYKIFKRQLIIEIIRVRHRKDAYRS